MCMRIPTLSCTLRPPPTFHPAANAAVTPAAAPAPGGNRLQDLGGLDLDAGAGLLFVPNIADLNPEGGTGSSPSPSSASASASSTGAGVSVTGGAPGAGSGKHRLRPRDGFGPNQGLFQHPQTQLRYRQQLRRDRELRLEHRIRAVEAQLAQVRAGGDEPQLQQQQVRGHPPVAECLRVICLIVCRWEGVAVEFCFVVLFSVRLSCFAVALLIVGIGVGCL